MNKTKEDLLMDQIMKIVFDNSLSETHKRFQIEREIRHHLNEFTRLHKNIRDTSLPMEKANRIADLYKEYGMYLTYTMIMD